jgi:hypothetical protein
MPFFAGQRDGRADHDDILARGRRSKPRRAEDQRSKQASPKPLRLAQIVDPHRLGSLLRIFFVTTDYALDAAPHNRASREGPGPHKSQGQRKVPPKADRC